MNVPEIIAIVVPISVLGIFITQSLRHRSVLKINNKHEDAQSTKLQAHELTFYDRKKEHEILLLGKKNEYEIKMTELKYTHEIMILDKSHAQSIKLSGK